MKPAIFLAVSAVAVLLLFAAPASAANVSCGQTITTTTVLDGDVVCPDTSPEGVVGVNIGASNITLWLNGFSIRSESGGSLGTGIASDTEVSGVNIRGGGGSIEGFDKGVSLIAADSSIRGVRATGSSGGIGTLGPRNYVYRNVVDISQNFYASGIYMGGVDAYAWGNTVRGSAFAGIIVSDDRPRVVLNTIESCDLNAPNGGGGIIAYGYTTSAVISKNTVKPCASTGGSGLYLQPSTSPPLGGSGVSVRRNIVTGWSFGISVDGGAAILDSNTTNGNADTGIRIEDDYSNQKVENNTANNNGNYGINVPPGNPPGSHDGGGNHASGNGIANCVNVSCTP